MLRAGEQLRPPRQKRRRRIGRVAATPVVAGNGLRSAIVWHRRV